MYTQRLMTFCKRFARANDKLGDLLNLAASNCSWCVFFVFIMKLVGASMGESHQYPTRAVGENPSIWTKQWIASMNSEKTTTLSHPDV